MLCFPASSVKGRHMSWERQVNIGVHWLRPVSELPVACTGGESPSRSSSSSSILAITPRESRVKRRKTKKQRQTNIYTTYAIVLKHRLLLLKMLNRAAHEGVLLLGIRQAPVSEGRRRVLLLMAPETLRCGELERCYSCRPLRGNVACCLSGRDIASQSAGRSYRCTSGICRSRKNRSCPPESFRA